MLPLVSEALAVMLKLEPAVILLPLDGLVMATTGAAGAVTVTATGLELTETPLASIATAMNE